MIKQPYICINTGCGRETQGKGFYECIFCESKFVDMMRKRRVEKINIDDSRQEKIKKEKAIALKNKIKRMGKRLRVLQAKRKMILAAKSSKEKQKVLIEVSAKVMECENFINSNK